MDTQKFFIFKANKAQSPFKCYKFKVQSVANCERILSHFKAAGNKVYGLRMTSEINGCIVRVWRFNPYDYMLFGKLYFQLRDMATINTTL